MTLLLTERKLRGQLFIVYNNLAAWFWGRTVFLILCSKWCRYFQHLNWVRTVIPWSNQSFFLISTPCIQRFLSSFVGWSQNVILMQICCYSDQQLLIPLLNSIRALNLWCTPVPVQDSSSICEVRQIQSRTVPQSVKYVSSSSGQFLSLWIMPVPVQYSSSVCELRQFQCGIVPQSVKYASSSAGYSSICEVRQSQWRIVPQSVQ